MADLKQSDVTGTVGDPSNFKKVTLEFGSHESVTLDVHTDDGIDEITDELEQFLRQWRGFFTDA